MAGDAAAREFRAEHALGTEPVHDLRALIAQIAELRLTEKVLVEDIDGAYAYDRALQRGFILLNAKRHWTRRRFTMAHELGHHVLGHQERVDKNVLDLYDPTEVEANAFAAELLMPATAIRESPRVHGMEEVAELAGHFSVSGSAMIVRLAALRVIDNTLRQKLEAEYDPVFVRGFFQADVPDRIDTSGTVLPRDFVDAVLKRYVAGRVSREAAIEALDITEADAEELLPPFQHNMTVMERANSGLPRSSV
ncbi:MAG: ImmA/IrrE family metallo-endopeptidase [Candidatus Eremiobacteraeota bacterium]|nr:ImmA/IrrE family metallo-endopeptidase [Candidatus Eremiobacteraeota bacterium]